MDERVGFLILPVLTGGVLIAFFFGCVAALDTLERFRDDGSGTDPSDDSVRMTCTDPTALWPLRACRRIELSDFGVVTGERSGSPVLFLGGVRMSLCGRVIVPGCLGQACGDDLGDGKDGGFAE